MLLPLACVVFLQIGGITIGGYRYSIQDLGRWARVGGLLPELLLAVFATELLSVGWAESSLRHLLFVRTASFWSDICVFVTNHLHMFRFIDVILTFGISLVSFGWLPDRLADATGFRFGLDILPRAPQFLIAFFIYSLLDYWDHRIAHMRVLWPLHRFHHAAEEFYIFTSNRVHPADVSSMFIMTGPLVLLGVAPDVLVTVGIFRMYIGWIQHSKIPGDWGWFGRWVINSPAGHRKHHDLLDVSEPACNFALVPLWDRLFGTWRGGGSQQSVIGVSTPYRHGAWFYPDLWRDYCDFLRQLLRRLGRVEAPPSNQAP
ncbi:MAG: sterol desaturase family protein [Pseudomonadota bacterium]|nr:sterol desaturase family protein [Pseudomonadota bacterium]